MHPRRELRTQSSSRTEASRPSQGAQSTSDRGLPAQRKEKSRSSRPGTKNKKWREKDMPATGEPKADRLRCFGQTAERNLRNRPGSGRLVCF